MELKANHKFIDASCVAHLIAAGEKYADTLTFSVDRYYHGKDLYGCMFVIRGVNSAGALSLQTLAQETADTAILLTWDISPAFTAVSGMLALEIVCYDNDSMILKYTVTPMQVRESVLEEYSGGVDAIEEALKEMEQILEETRAVSVKLPIIQNGTWWLYNTDSGAYEDSGQPVQGPAGQDGRDGHDGAPGKDGADGAPGADGKDGAPGADGRDGQDGADGKSAYQIWLDAGNTGTKADFLASLKGEKGDAGEQGAPGTDGQNGADGKDGAPGADGKDGTDGQDGADGKSAYEIWLAAGNTGTEEEFLASLKGEKGDTGAAGADGKTPDISNVENTVEALASALSDTGWVESTGFSGNPNDDLSGRKLYYRKIGATMTYMGMVDITNDITDGKTVFQQNIPHGLYTNVSAPLYANPGDGNGMFLCGYISLLSNKNSDTTYAAGYVRKGVTVPAGSTCVFQITTHTNDAPADVSSLLAALADLVEV